MTSCKDITKQEEETMKEVLNDFWKEIAPQDKTYFDNHLAYITGSLTQNIEKGIKKIYKYYLGNPTTISRLRKEKELLLAVNSQIKDENAELRNTQKCEWCSEKGTYQKGGVKKRLFWFCSKECENKYYNFISKSSQNTQNEI